VQWTVVLRVSVTGIIITVASGDEILAVIEIPLQLPASCRLAA